MGWALGYRRDGRVSGRGRRRGAEGAIGGVGRAPRGHGLVATGIAAIVVAVAALMLTLMVIVVVDMTAAVIGLGPVIPHGLVPSGNGTTGALQRLEAFLHALQNRQVGTRISQ